MPCTGMCTHGYMEWVNQTQTTAGGRNRTSHMNLRQTAIGYRHDACDDQPGPQPCLLSARWRARNSIIIRIHVIIVLNAKLASPHTHIACNHNPSQHCIRGSSTLDARVQPESENASTCLRGLCEAVTCGTSTLRSLCCCIVLGRHRLRLCSVLLRLQVVLRSGKAPGQSLLGGSC